MSRRETNLGHRTRRTEGSRRLLSNMTEEERASVRERNRLSAMVFRIADMNFELGDMNSYIPDDVYVHL
jgi:hypothetical protein